MIGAITSWRGGWVIGVASALMLTLTSCGGAGDSGSIRSAPVLTAVVPGCGDVPVHDSGSRIYVVMNTGCVPTRPDGKPLPPGEAVSIDLGLGSDGTLISDSKTTVLLHEAEESAGALDIKNIGMRSVGLFRSGQWRKFDNTDSWVARDGAGLVVLNGEIYLLGGWLNGPISSEVWKTSDLVHWEFLGNAPWPGRHGAAWLVHDQQLWVIGGDLLTDVWSSPDGVTWTQHSENAPFGPRYTPNAVSMNGEIIVYAGLDWQPDEDVCGPRPECVPVGNRSVWKSRDGQAWELVTAEAPWSGRGLIHGSILRDGEIFLVGGGLKYTRPGDETHETSAEFSDIWSSTDGATWRRRLEQFSFSPRTHFSVVETPMGCFVSDGSVTIQTNLSNDLFVARDCINYVPVAHPEDLGTRHASSVAYFNGSIVILGGPHYGTAGTKVWQYFP